MRSSDQYVTALFVSVFVLVFGSYLISNNSLLKAPKVSTQTTLVKQEDLKRYLEEVVLFSTDILLKRNKTEISFPFSFDQDVEIIWLGYTTENEDDIASTEILVSHPQMMNLTWDIINSGKLYLHQKNATYTSIEDFLRNPPDVSLIAVDPWVKQTFSELQGSKDTNDPEAMNGTEYLLTTFTHSEYASDVYYFKRTIDASNARINISNQIDWYLKAPLLDVGDSYLIGNLAINYLQ